jgi:predicted transcriptional regulator
MTTYALPISDKIAARLASLPQEKVNAVNAELNELIVEILEEQEPDITDYLLSAEDIASIRQGLADSDSGRVHDGEEVLAELRVICGRTN